MSEQYRQPAAGPHLGGSDETYLAAFTQHLLCNQILVQAVVEGMKAAGYGRIINIVSNSVSQPINGLGVSNTIRGVVATWAKTLAGDRPLWEHRQQRPARLEEDAALTAILESRARARSKSLAEIEAEERSPRSRSGASPNLKSLLMPRRLSGFAGR